MRLAANLATLAALIAIGLGFGRWLREPNLGGLVFLGLVCAAVAVAARHLHRPTAAPAPSREQPAAAVRDHRVDLNRAGVDELQRLPGVGPVAAARIVAEREAGGPFESVQALVRVPGFGPAKVRVLADDARV